MSTTEKTGIAVTVMGIDHWQPVALAWTEIKPKCGKADA